MADEVDHDVIVVGGGVAGLHTAITVAEDGWRVWLIDGSGGGGRLLNLGPIADYPLGDDEESGPDIAARLLELAMEHGVDFAFDTVTTIDATRIDEAAGPRFTVATDGDASNATVVVIATGRSDGQLGLAGETDLVGRGISFCATCDGPLYADKSIVVVGGSDWAVDEALHLSEYARQITLLVDGDALDCASARRQRIEDAPKIELLTGTTITGLHASGGVLASVELKDPAGTRTVGADGVFPMRGWRPNTSFVPSQVARDDDDSIRVDRVGESTVAGLYAVGDVARSSIGTVLEASGGGVIAGMAIARRLARS